MKITCPHCNNSYPLDALTEDHAARELFGLLQGGPVSAAPLLSYLGLFKPRQQALRWTRAKQLAVEVLALAHECGAASIDAALIETVEALRERRQAPAWKPLSNHNYLRSVIESQQSQRAVAVVQPAGSRGRSAGSKALDALEELK